MNVYYIHAEPRFIFFFKTLQIQISQLPTWSGPTHFSSVLVNACSLITDNIWEKYSIYVYDYSDNFVLNNASHIYACTHPDPQFKVMAETSTFGIFRGWNVRAETSKAEIVFSPYRRYFIERLRRNAILSFRRNAWCLQTLDSAEWYI